MQHTLNKCGSVFTLACLVFNMPLWSKSLEYGAILCKHQGYHCLKIKRKNSWSQLFLDPGQRDLVKRVNRTNEFLEPGMIIAVPDNLKKSTLLDLSPFPLTIKSDHESVIIIDQKQLAWGAYNKLGQLLRWGPISAGTPRCFESPQGCSTPIGTFRITHKQGKDCVSKSLPQTNSGEKGGAYMPYCMYFYKGYALHGSESLPGYRASHGCVRMYLDDAKWLYDNFVVASNVRGLGTKIVVKSIE